jgi:hypothetical protein
MKLEEIRITIDQPFGRFSKRQIDDPGLWDYYSSGSVE